MKNLKIAIIGLGYVGLPFAVEFGKRVPVIGFDIDKRRFKELKRGQDYTIEVSPEELQQATQLSYSANLDNLKRFILYYESFVTSCSFKYISINSFSKGQRNDWSGIKPRRYCGV